MKAIALFGVFLTAKALVVGGHNPPLSVWSPVAYIWQDVLVAVIFAGLDYLITVRTRNSESGTRYSILTRQWFSWALYSMLVAYTALNVPVARVLSSVLTLPMVRASGGALSDSIFHHATWGNLGALMLVLAAGACLPLIVTNVVSTRGRVLLLAALVIIALGPTATRRVETIGLHRNPLVAIVSSSLPRVSAKPAITDAREWRESPFAVEAADDGMARWRGRAAGRNVILVVLESAGAGYLKPYGAKVDPMPRLTALAKDSLVFDSAYAVYPESVKTLFSVLCARYPRSASASANGSDGPGRIVTPSIGTELKAKGYRTGLFHSGRFMYLGMDDVVKDRGYDLLEDAGAIGGNRESSFGVEEGPTVRRMLSWIDSLPKQERFFLTYLPIAGHHPYDTPEPGPFPENEESQRYLNALNYADRSLGELIDGIRARGLAERTMFVVFGDHGEAFGQHEGNYGHSLFIYDENVRVPYFVIAPGLINGELRVSRPVSLIDTAPTILDFLGFPVPGAFEGESLLARGNKMALFFTDYSLNFAGLRDECWKYIYDASADRSRLFNVCEDAAESRDVSREHAQRVAEYKVRVVDWSAAQASR